MIITTDILYAIADWARVTGARVTGVYHYAHIGRGVTVSVDIAAFRAAFAGAAVDVARGGPGHNYDVWYGPDMGGWCAEATTTTFGAVERVVERVTL